MNLGLKKGDALQDHASGVEYFVVESQLVDGCIALLSRSSRQPKYWPLQEVYSQQRIKLHRSDTANLHPTWVTPKQSRQGMRATEVKSWLTLHPEFSNAWVVIDTGFKNWSPEALSYVVLCQLEVGLQTLEVAQLHDALERRKNIKN